MATDEQSMTQTICSGIAYHVAGFTDKEVMAMFERYGSFDILISILGLCERFQCGAEQAEGVLHERIQKHTQNCFGFYDGRISTGRGSNTCRVFRHGIPWLEIIKPDAVARKAVGAGAGKGGEEGFLND